MQFEIHQPEDWKKVIAQILPLLHTPILLLKGNLGAGKTTFTHYLLKELGSRDEVSSPTYTIVNEYDSPKGKIYHFDLYRMKNAEEVYDLGIEEYLDNSFLCIIEWPEIFETELPENIQELSIVVNEQSRVVNFK